MKNTLFILCCWIACSLSLQAQQMETLNSVKPDGYNYWFYSPQSYDTTTEPSDSITTCTSDAAIDSTNCVMNKPLIVFLHGQSICGKDMNRVLRYGTIDALRRGMDIDAYVIAPLNPGGRWDPSKVLDIVDWSLEHHPIDSCRVYVLGMSLGGFGTINVAAAYPNRFAAAMALCGGGNNPDYKSLCEIPLWILHGTADKDVKIKDSDEVVQGMREVCKPERLQYNRLKGLNHSILARVFYMPQTYKWLFAHSLKDEGRKLCKDYDIQLSDFSHAYDGLESPSWNKIKYIKNNSLKVKESESSYDGKATYYKVKSGDTLYSIAKRHHTTIKKLCQLNNIKETTILSIGRKLKVR